MALRRSHIDRALVGRLPQGLGGTTNRKRDAGRNLSHNVLVTFVIVRGSSGFKPFSSARHAANSCAGMIYGIGVKNSSSPTRIQITTVVSTSASRLLGPGITSVSGLSCASF